MRLEFWDKIHLYCREYSDNMLHAVLRLSGPVDVPRFKDAFTRAAELNPVLKSRLTDGRKPYWEETDISGAVTVYDEGTTEEFFLSPIDVYNEPQIKAGIFRRGTGDAVALMMNRVVADIKWLGVFAEELCRAYADPEYQVRIAPLRNFRLFFRNFTIRERRAIASLKQAKLPKNIKFAHFPEPKAGEQTPRIIKRTISAEQMENVRLYTKHIGVSIDDILIAAYIRSIREHFKSERAINIDCAIDLRSYLRDDGKQLFTNYISHTNCNVGDDIGDELVDTIFKVNLALRHTRSSFAGLDGLKRLYTLARFAPKKGIAGLAGSRYQRSALLYINNGEIRAESLGDIRITHAFTLNSIKKSRFAELNLSTFGNTGVIALPIAGGKEEIELAENVLDNLITQLDALKVISIYK